MTDHELLELAAKAAGRAVAAQAAVIEALRAHLKVIAGLQLCADNLMSNADIAAKALAIPTNSTQILDEVRRAERQRCIYVINAQKNPITTSYANGLVFDPANNMVDKCAAAIRAMG